jgi:tetratricopeptide (TPR) repeat protein
MVSTSTGTNGGSGGGTSPGIGSISVALTAAPTDGAQSFYEVLGVPESATAEEVRSAYFRLVRQFPPEDHPELFQRLSIASSTLADPRRRNEYDQLRRAGSRVRVLVDQAAVAADRDPFKAMTLLKSAIALAPDTPRPRLLLAQVLMRMDDPQTAERQYRWLLREAPRDETLHLKLARCLLAQDRIEEAEQALATATKINARFYDAYVLLARLYEKTQKYALAVYALERAVENDDVEDYADFDALSRLLVLYLRLDNNAEAERTARRLIAVVLPGDPIRAQRAARRLIARARDHVEEREFKRAAVLLTTAGRLPDIGETLAAEIEAARLSTVFKHEASQAQNDALVADSLRLCLQVRYLERLSDDERAGRLDEAVQRLLDEVTADPQRVAASVEYFRREYVAVGEDLAALLGEVASRAARRIEWLTAQASARGIPADSEPSSAGDAEKSAERQNPAGRRGILGWLRGGRRGEEGA